MKVKSSSPSPRSITVLGSLFKSDILIYTTLRGLNVQKRMHLITIRVVTTITPSRIKEEMMTTIRLSSANLLKLRNVRRKISAGELTIELSVYIIRTSTKLNFVTSFLTKYNNVSIMIIAHSLTLLRI